MCCPAMQTPWRPSGSAAGTLTVQVQPGARDDCVVGYHGDALKIRLRARAVDGAANAALLSFLARRLDLGPGQVVLRHGTHSRRKVLVLSELCSHQRQLLDLLLSQSAPVEPHDHRHRPKP
jgi:uncharacterized protein (TIGR00251 family)